MTTVYAASPIQTVLTFCAAGESPPAAGAGQRLWEQEEVIAELRAQLQQQDALIAALREQNAHLQEQVSQLQKEIRQLREQLD